MNVYIVYNQVDTVEKVFGDHHDAVKHVCQRIFGEHRTTFNMDEIGQALEFIDIQKVH